MPSSPSLFSPVGRAQINVGAPPSPSPSAGEVNAASQTASSQTGEPTASTRGSIGECSSTTSGTTDLENLRKQLKKLSLKHERFQHHMAFLSTHQAQDTTPKGLKLQVEISVPDYKGSALESSIRSLQEEASKQARDLVLEHYSLLASKTSQEIEALRKQMSLSVRSLKNLDEKDKDNLLTVVKEKQIDINRQAERSRKALKARRMKKLSHHSTAKDTTHPKGNGGTKSAVPPKRAAQPTHHQQVFSPRPLRRTQPNGHPAPPRKCPPPLSCPTHFPPISHQHPPTFPAQIRPLMSLRLPPLQRPPMAQPPRDIPPLLSLRLPPIERPPMNLPPNGMSHIPPLMSLSLPPIRRRPPLLPPPPTNHNRDPVD